MHGPRRRSLLPLALLVAALAGCGAPKPALRLGGVSYEVRAARGLHAGNPGDRAFFAGVAPGGRRLERGRVWLGVFLQAVNGSAGARRTASSITLADAAGHAFRPVPAGAANDYACRQETLGPGATEPGLDSPASSSPEQGCLLLFRVPPGDLRPVRRLDLRVAGGGRTAAVPLSP